MNSFDDKTVRLSRSPLSTEQGSDADVATRPRAIVDEAPNALPVGTRLAEFEILGLIGEGGFGIVYLAWDTHSGATSHSRNTCRPRSPRVMGTRR